MVLLQEFNLTSSFSLKQTVPRKQKATVSSEIMPQGQRRNASFSFLSTPAMDIYYYTWMVSTWPPNYSSNKFKWIYFGIGLFSRNDLKRMKACRGRWRGTSCPAPVTDTKVRPLYTWLHPPTCIVGEQFLWRDYRNNSLFRSNSNSSFTCKEKNKDRLI